MSDSSTVCGGGTAPHKGAPLTPGEHHAAQQALLKLTGSSGALLAQNVHPTGGSGLPSLAAVKSLLTSGGLHAGLGNDTFAGGVHSGGVLPAFASDSVASASATIPAVHLQAASGFYLSADTINVAGATAAGVKAQDPLQDQHAAHTVTLADKTTLNITGVSAHSIIKPHH